VSRDDSPLDAARRATAPVARGAEQASSNVDNPKQTITTKRPAFFFSFFRRHRSRIARPSRLRAHALITHSTSTSTTTSWTLNFAQLLEKRPVSPDVFDVDGGAHYQFPAVALSSITNRVTGCVLSGAVGFGGAVSALGGPEALPAFVEAFKSTAPILVFPTKLALSFPFVFHTLGGFRHIYWDKTTAGIDNESAKTSSLALFAASGLGAAALASYTF
jgi:succinate dehydrogenase (ubiquinone) cytochrome b560 subunit